MYDEIHSGFGDPWSTLVAFKDSQTRQNWYRNAAEVELQLRKRILSTKTGGSPLRYFDGATIGSYQVPASAFETIYCRQQDAPTECYSSSRGGNAVSNETNNVAGTYNPVLERHISLNSFSSDKPILNTVYSWKTSIF